MAKAPADIRATSDGAASNGGIVKLSTRMYAAQKPNTPAATIVGTPGSASTASSEAPTAAATAIGTHGRARIRSGTRPITKEAGTCAVLSVASAGPTRS